MKWKWKRKFRQHVDLHVCVCVFLPYRSQFKSNFHHTSHTRRQQSGEGLVKFLRLWVIGQGRVAMTVEGFNYWMDLNYTNMYYILETVFQFMGSKVSRHAAMTMEILACPQSLINFYVFVVVSLQTKISLVMMNSRRQRGNERNQQSLSLP